MLSEHDEPGIGLGAFLLSMNTILVLEKNNVITYQAAKEILEQALQSLAVHQTQAGPTSEEASKAARVLLEQFGSLLARSAGDGA